MSNGQPQIQLSDQQIADAENALMVLNRLIPQIDALEQCGEDCQDRRRRVSQLQSGLQKLLNSFGRVQV